jgi:AcrR family transcriptional regulator
VTGVDARVDSRERLLLAAAELLAERGVEGLGLREIARRAGMSHGAPQRHFPTLAALLSALATRAFEDLMASVTDAVAAVDEDSGQRAPNVDRLVAAGQGYAAFALAEPGAFTLMFRPELCDPDDFTLAATSLASFNQLATLVAAVQEDGWQAEAPTLTLAGALWAAVHGAVTLWLQGAIQGATETGRIDELLDLQFRLLLGPTPERAGASSPPQGARRAQR